MTKLVRRYVAEAADAVAGATLPVLMLLGLVRVPVPVPVRVIAQRRR